MDAYVDAKVSLIVLIIIVFLLALFFCISSIVASYGYSEAKNANAAAEVKPRMTVIIDAGHGGEDPGAICGSVIEKNLNLSVAKKLYDFAASLDVDIIMTRADDVLLYNRGEEKSKKQYDLKNRVKIIEAYENCVVISIHMNKFAVESCKGLQAFYSDTNEQSIKLAQYIQEQSKLLQAYNTRDVKNENGTIYLLENTTKPAVLVECGFISNSGEAQQLADGRYQTKLAFTIFTGLVKWMDEYENSLCVQ